MVGADQERGPRPPTLLDGILPVVVLIGLIAVTMTTAAICGVVGNCGRSRNAPLPADA